MSGRVLRVIGVIVAVLALLTIVLLILVKTIFTPVVSSAPKTAPGRVGNVIPDALDLVAGARREVTGHTLYDASYYKGGYPPPGRGACTDLVWRAFRQAGYNLKDLVDQDIRDDSGAYGATGQHPDPNIAFRRAGNLDIFFKRHAQSLTTQVTPGDVSNLIQWQPGDIVVFGNGNHIGIISDQRRPDGVPLLIHNAGPWATEGDYLLRYPSPITGHYRFSGKTSTDRFMMTVEQSNDARHYILYSQEVPAYIEQGAEADLPGSGTS